MSTPDSPRAVALMENLFADPASKVPTKGATQVSSAAGRLVRPRFRAVSPLAADAAKRMLGYSERVDLRLNSGVFVVRPTGGLFALPEADVFDLVVGGAEFQLEVERLFELLEVPADWWENLPGSFRADLLADTLREFCGGTALRVAHAGTNRHPDARRLPCEMAFSLERDTQRAGYRARLRFGNAAAAAQLVAAWERLPLRGGRRLPDFSLPARVEILSTTIPVGELQRLRVGALVPVGAPLEGKDVVVSIGWGGRFVAPAVINNKIVTLRGGVKPMDESQAGNVGVALSDLSKMENLEVQFTVELATCSLPLSELARLGAGSTLNLGLPHEPPLVRLCVNGKAVATGELVVLGQSLGVQIVEMAPA